MKKYKNEVALGLFTLVAAGILGYMTLSVGKFEFGDTTDVKAIFDNASGIVKDSNVMISGVRVGHVNRIGLEDSKAVMSIVLDENVKVSRNVKAVIRAKSLLGEKYVELVPFKSTEYLQDGDIIKNTVTPVEIDQLVSILAPAIMKLTPLLEKIDPDEVMAIFETFSTAFKGKEEHLSRIIINTDALFSYLASNRSRMDRILVNLEGVTADTRSLINNNRVAVNRIISNTDRLTASFGKDAEELAHKLDIITSDLVAITTDFRENSPGLTKKLNLLTDDLSVVVTDFRSNSPDFSRRLNTTLKELEVFLGALNNEAPDLAKDLGVVTGDLAEISGILANRGPNMIHNTDETLARLVVTLQKLEPMMTRLEQFDEEKLIERVEKIMKETGIKIRLF